MTQLIAAHVKPDLGMGFGHHRVDWFIADIGVDQVGATALLHLTQDALGFTDPMRRRVALGPGALVRLLQGAESVLRQIGDEVLQPAPRETGMLRRVPSFRRGP